VLGGVLLGLAIATKVTPVLAVPGVLRRGWRLICVSAAAAIVIVYVPHVVAVGSKVIGFLPGYLNQEGYSGGTGFAIIGLFAHGKTATAVAVVILGLVAVAILRYCDPARPWRGGVLMTSAALTVCTPQYQWYSILLVMLVALDGEPEYLAIAAGGYLASTTHLYIHGFVLHDPRLFGYGAGAAVAGILATARLLRARWAKPAPATGTVTDTMDAMDAMDAVDAVDAMDAVTGQAAALADNAAAIADDPVHGRAPVNGGAPVNGSTSVNGQASVNGHASVIGHASVKNPTPALEPTPVLEPTAMFGRSAVVVTIGADGKPFFAADED